MSRTDAERSRDWLARLGQPVDLDHAFFAIAGVHPRAPGRTIVTGELGTGRVAAGDALEAVGYAGSPIPTRVVLVEGPDPRSGAVGERREGVAGDALGLTLEHGEEASLVPGQCLAPRGRLRAASRVEGEAWIVTSADLPCMPEEQRAILEELAAGRGLELFFHTRSVAASVVGGWRPALGAEYRLAFDLAAPVPLYDGARFGLRYAGLTVGAGFIL